jgi:two-component system cell cycle sensor histidine kinase/response regulator CckA
MGVVGKATGSVGEGVMRDRDRTKEELLKEIGQLRRQVARLRRQETERRRVEEAFLESEKKYKELADLLPQTVFETDAEGNLTFVNRHAFTMFGYTQEDFDKGLNAVETIAPRDRAEASKNIRRVLRGEDVGGAEYWVRRKDGTAFPVIIHACRILSGKKPVGMRGIIVDISERKKIEEALKESEAKFRTLFELSPQAIALTEPGTGRLIEVNGKLCELTGWTREQILGRQTTERGFYSKQDRARFVEELKRSGEVNGFEMDFRAKDGSILNTLMFTRVVRIAGKRLILTIFIDLTDYKRLEAQLLQSQKMESVGQLAGGIAHDFNNLLMAIQGYAELGMMRTSPGNPVCGDLQEILKASERAARFTSQLLAFSRRQVLEPKVVNLSEVVSGMAPMLRRLMGEDVGLVVKTDASLGRVRVDPSQIEQVVVNLVANARDAMPNGGRLGLETANVTLDGCGGDGGAAAPAGEYIMLRISDTGMGMSPEVRAHIFEPFYTTKEVGKGTGLGLSTSYGIIKQSGGYVDVQSELGRGTTFRVYLPRVHDKAQSPSVDTKKDPSSRAGETVLVVEDEEQVRDVAVRILREHHYDVLAAGDGEEALRLVKTHNGKTIHLLLTDVVMPRMSGRILADRLKVDRPEIKCIFISGHTDDTLVHHRVEDQGTLFLQKPFSPSLIVRKVREALDG